MPLEQIKIGVVAVGAAAAGTALWKVAVLRRGRWVIAALVAYAEISFVYAILNGISLHNTLTGRVLLPAIPWMIQGAFIGAFVVLPLAWIVSVVRTGIPRFKEGVHSSAIVQVVAFTTCIALLVTSLVPPDHAQHELNPQQRAAQLDNSLRAIADGDSSALHDIWNPDYVVGKVGRDSQALFQWVQGNTYWIPYRGVLRGPLGVLIDRQGSSLDRALLLAMLLEKAGGTVRLAHGELSKEDAISMLPEIVSERVMDFDSPGEKKSRLSANLREAVMQYSLNGSSIEQTVAEQEQAIDRVSTELDARVENQTKRLLQAAAPANERDEWGKRFEDNVAALRDHWWVQRLDSGRWIDFDLLISGNRGIALTVAKETLSINELAEDLYHQVAIRVIGEQWSAGAVKEYKVLEHVLRPSDAIGQSIVLQFMPTDWLENVSSTIEPVNDIRKAVLSQREWVAGLTVGRKGVASAILRDSAAQSGTKGGPFGGFGAVLNNTLNGSSSETKRILSAVWIEYEIRIPGEKPHTVRRTVFDLIGPAARHAGNFSLSLDDEKKLTRGFALSMKTEILPVVCQFAPEFVAHQTAQALVASRDLLGSITNPDFSPDSDKSKLLLEQAEPPISPLMGLAYTRLEWNHSSDHIFINQPNILTRHQFLRSTDKGIVFDNAIDIVANEVGVDTSVRNSYALRMQQGVRDTNNEALLFGGGGTGNTGNAFTDSGGWLTITPTQLSLLSNLNFSENARRHIAEDLENGYLVVTPKAPVHRSNEDFVGWWRVDPQTGSSLGIAENGWGQDMEENSLAVTAVLRFGRAFVWENGLCHVYSQAVNSTIVIKELLVGDWHPSWTGPATQSRDPRQVYQDSKKMCVIQAIVAGFVATLPLLLLTLKNSRSIRALRAAEEAEELAPRRTPPRDPCPSLAMMPLVNRTPLASISVVPLFAMFTGTLPCVPGNGPPHGEAPKVQENPSKPNPNPTPPEDPCPAPPTPATNGQANWYEREVKQLDAMAQELESAEDQAIARVQAAQRDAQANPGRADSPQVLKANAELADAKLQLKRIQKRLQRTQDLEIASRNLIEPARRIDQAKANLEVTYKAFKVKENAVAATMNSSSTYADVSKASMELYDSPEWNNWANARKELAQAQRAFREAQGFDFSSLDCSASADKPTPEASPVGPGQTVRMGLPPGNAVPSTPNASPAGPGQTVGMGPPPVHPVLPEQGTGPAPNYSVRPPSPLAQSIAGVGGLDNALKGINPK